MVNNVLLGLVNSILGRGSATARGNHSYHCPFCNHKNPKLEVNLIPNKKNENPWHCWVCDTKGKTLHTLFKRLKRLFSTDVIIRNQGGNELKVLDVDSIQRSGDIATNSLLDRYNRIYSPNSTSLFGQQLNVNYQYLRTFIYSDYDVMDNDAIVASALDIIADESSLKNDMRFFSVPSSE